MVKYILKISPKFHSPLGLDYLFERFRGLRLGHFIPWVLPGGLGGLLYPLFGIGKPNTSLIPGF